MANVPLGIDVTPIVTGAIDSISSIWTSYNQKEQAKIEAEAVASLSRNQSGAASGMDIKGYIPWLAGGIAGIALLFFVMKR